MTLTWDIIQLVFWLIVFLLILVATAAVLFSPFILLVLWRRSRRKVA